MTACGGRWFGSHSWLAWGEPKEVDMVRVLTLHGKKQSTQEYVKLIQERKCLLCGMVQQRQVVLE
jgi:hypothetical protein